MRPAKLLKIAQNILHKIFYDVLLQVLTNDLIITKLSWFEIFKIIYIFLKIIPFLWRHFRSILASKSKKSNHDFLVRVKKIMFQKKFFESLHPLGQNNFRKILEFENSNGDFYAICGGGTIFFGLLPGNSDMLFHMN